MTTFNPSADIERRIRTVPYAAYLRYTLKLQNLDPAKSVAFPSMFLQRYARLYNRDTGQERPLVLEPWQVWAIDDPSDQSVWVKPRQVGFSFLRAARALAKSLLQRNYTAVFVSYNRDEAKNKILYARALYESIQYHGKPRLIGDSMAELRFSNGSRIVSLPAKAVRGYTMPDVFADEAAFIPNADSLFSGTLSSGVRGGDGTFTAGSTPYGEANFFARLFANEGNIAPDFIRHRIEWWYSPAMCSDVPGALKHAKSMTTQDRVEKYGSRKLQSIFRALRLEDFQREHECSFSARDDSVIPRGRLLAACVWPDDPNEGCVTRHWGGEDPITPRVYDREIIPAIAEAIGYMHPTSSFVAGYDVARSSNGDPACLALVEERRDGQRITRGFLMFHGMDWPQQESMLKGVASDRQNRRLFIDGTQIGAKLANDVRSKFVRDGTPWDEGRVVAVNFGVEQQRNGVFHAVVQAVQAQDVRIYPHDDLFRHFSAFKREPESGRFADRYALLRGVNRDGSGHHAEIVVALGLALYDYPVRKPQPRSSVRAKAPGNNQGAMPTKQIGAGLGGSYAMTPGGIWVPDDHGRSVDRTRSSMYHAGHGTPQETATEAPDARTHDRTHDVPEADAPGGRHHPAPVRESGRDGQVPRSDLSRRAGGNLPTRVHHAGRERPAHVHRSRCRHPDRDRHSPQRHGRYGQRADRPRRGTLPGDPLGQRGVGSDAARRRHRERLRTHPGCHRRAPGRTVPRRTARRPDRPDPDPL